ncbi:uncharacterized protein LOC132872704 [Neoarius graeffei]|uniref:uncharacterized protein LOC132872704 n=1 Tax=Neoarius graeffei TaxID=443677 RepID=UPI00298D00AF|nr:uncharacterized protein LOC132872704 [Neoarius graeffei]
MSIGCICHLTNLCVKAGVTALPFKVDDVLVDVFYFFHHSSKRIQDFKEFQQFTEVEEQQILKHCPTCWLSLEKVCNRLLSQLPALRSYFVGHKDVEKPGKVKSINDRLQEPLTELILLFLQYILPVLNQFNILFQGEDCMVVSLLPEMDRLLRKFAVKFLELKHVKSCRNLREFDVGNQELQQSDDKLAVGPAVRSRLVELEEDLDAKTAQVVSSVRGFYEAAARKMMDKFPFDNDVLVNLAVLDPSKKDDLDYSSVVNLTSSFGFDLEQLKDEWKDFQLMPDDVVPCRANDGKKVPIAVYWGKVLDVKAALGVARFPMLKQLFTALLCLPQSDADSERAFSLVRKIHPEDRKNTAADT